eukprot:scaffold5904_cov30-Tisochrysis_lutea.AAC.2
MGLLRHREPLVQPSHSVYLRMAGRQYMHQVEPFQRCHLLAAVPKARSILQPILQRVLGVVADARQWRAAASWMTRVK